MLELRILSGLHRGAALPLDGDVVRLGSDAANDIVLTDPGMPEHAVELSRRADEGWTLSHVEGSAPATTVAAGMRVSVGPILVGFAEEHESWLSETESPASGDGRSVRRVAARWLAGLAALCALGAAATLVLVLAFGKSAANDPAALPGTPSARDFPVAASKATARHEPAVRRVDAVVYPARAELAPLPFGIVSVRGGAHGFVVTDDGRVLVPGNVWREFTLERIEPRRIVFSGPRAAELPW